MEAEKTDKKKVEVIVKSPKVKKVKRRKRKSKRKVMGSYGRVEKESEIQKKIFTLFTFLTITEQQKVVIMIRKIVDKKHKKLMQKYKKLMQ